MQQLWLRGVGWDDPLPTDLAELWKTWLEHLPDLASLQLPRCYSRKGKTVVMGIIHAFVDARNKPVQQYPTLDRSITMGMCQSSLFQQNLALLL